MDKDDFEWLCIFLLFGVSITLGLWASYEGPKAECRAYGELTGYEVRMLEGSKCVVNDPDKGWISAWRR
jgi:hypothetical protein